MYRVVGCNRCSALWVVEDRPETTQCPRCRTRHQFSKLKAFAETEDATDARAARASLLAARSGEGDQDLDFAEMARTADTAGMDDTEFLAASGIDPADVAEAGDPNEGTTAPSRSRRDVVLSALEELDTPTEEAVVDRAGAAGVSGEFVREALQKLKDRGQVSESDGHYRLL